MNRYPVILIALITVGLLLAIEAISWWKLSQQKHQFSFLVNMPVGSIVQKTTTSGFNEIDPLCGWAISNDAIVKLGFQVKSNCVEFSTDNKETSKPIKILITGGSASDVVTHPANWPTTFVSLLRQNKIQAKVYVAAIAGYTSGQELLKLIRDGLMVQPDIHISYSGANDGDDGGYVSDYEKEFYEKSLKEGNVSLFLPNTVYFVRNILLGGRNQPQLKQCQPIEGFDFWRQNMSIMESIAIKNRYNFIGILQPVLGQGNFRSHMLELKNKNRVEKYKEFYPKIIEYIPSDSCLLNFTNLFDTASSQVFVDDCHLTDPYQHTVAQAVFKELLDRHLIK